MRRRLIIFVPGIDRRIDLWKPLEERLAKEPSLSDSDWRVWDHGKSAYSFGRATQSARSLCAIIDEEWAVAGGYEEIVMVGHSLGGLLVRQAYLFGCGLDHGLRQKSPWSGAVTRIVLLASVNRGFDITSSFWRKFIGWLYRMIKPLQSLLLFDLLRGSGFVTNLRIEWIRYFDELGDNGPTVTQILGDCDGIVKRDDSIDIEAFRNGYQITIPGATHGDLHNLDVKDANGRYALLRDAFVHEKPVQAESRNFTEAAKILFVLHGIKSSNTTWAQTVVRIAEDMYPDVKVIPASYGYLSALKFAFPATRKKNLGWFQDQYSEVLAKNPKAQFNFIGHSNGTYLLGESLRRIPGLRFNRIALVGSVLPTNYSWRPIFARDQVQRVRNERSNRDFPVGVLCSGLNGLMMKDVGTGGFEGFFDSAGLNIEEFFWHDGGHSSPLSEENLKALLADVLDEKVKKVDLVGSRSKFYQFLSGLARRVSPVLVLATLCAAAYLVVHPNFSGVRLLLLLGVSLLIYCVIDVL